MGINQGSRNVLTSYFQIPLKKCEVRDLNPLFVLDSSIPLCIDKEPAFPLIL